MKSLSLEIISSFSLVSLFIIFTNEATSCRKISWAFQTRALGSQFIGNQANCFMLLHSTVFLQDFWLRRQHLRRQSWTILSAEHSQNCEHKQIVISMIPPISNTWKKYIKWIDGYCSQRYFRPVIHHHELYWLLQSVTSRIISMGWGKACGKIAKFHSLGRENLMARLK